MITTYNTSETDTASEEHGKERHRKNVVVINHLLNFCADYTISGPVRYFELIKTHDSVLDAVTSAAHFS